MLKTRLNVVPGTTVGKRTILRELRPVGLRRRFKYRCFCGRKGTVWLNGLGNGQGCGCGKKGKNGNRKKPDGVAAVNALYSEYKKSAERRRIRWRLSKNSFKALIPQCCVYCGRPPYVTFKRGNRYGNLVYTGIDRRDNQQGYTQTNSVPCCQVCNYAKRKMTEREFAEWVRAVYINYVMSLNYFIAKTNEVTTPTVGIPTTDRTQQTDFGLGMAQRMAQQSQQPVEQPKPMAPIIPVAN